VISNTKPVEPDIKQRVAKMFAASEKLTEYGKTELQGFLHALEQHVVDEVMLRQPLENEARRDLAAASQGSVESFCESVSERVASVMIEAARGCEPCGRNHPDCHRATHRRLFRGRHGLCGLLPLQPTQTGSKPM
jgi:hypothetical protein